MRRVIPALTVLLLLAGCATVCPPNTSTLHPSAEVPPAASPKADGPRVQTDWSKLGERKGNERVGSRWYVSYTDRLLPADYGGELIPYAGLRLMDDWPARDGGGCLYGLMTLEGKVVTDPVYSEIQRVNHGDSLVRDPAAIAPALALRLGTGGGENEWNGQYAMAAVDGSWCTEAKYNTYTASAEGLFLVSQEGCELLDWEGGLVRAWTWEELGYSPERQAPFTGLDMPVIEWRNGLVLLEENEEQSRVLNTGTGALATLTAGEWDATRPEWHEYGDFRYDEWTGEAYRIEGDIFNGPMVLLDAQIGRAHV